MTALDATSAMRLFEARGLRRSYPALAAYQTNIGVREHLILQCRHQWERTLHELVEDLDKHGRLNRGLLRRLHLEQLEVLSHICMFIEDLAYIAYLLRHRPRSLDRSAHFTGRMRRETLDELTCLSTRALRARFRFPTVTALQLRDPDARVVREVFRTSAKGLQVDLNTVGQFVGQGHFKVYNEYKHTFDILVGAGALQGRTVHSHIYVRVAPQPTETGPEKTLILDGSPGALHRYDSVFAATSNLVNALVQNSLDWMIYGDGRYLVKIPVDYGLSEDLRAAYGSIVNQYRLGWAKTHTLQLAISFTQSAARAIEERLSAGAVAEHVGSLFSKRASTKSTLDVRQGDSNL